MELSTCASTHPQGRHSCLEPMTPVPKPEPLAGREQRPALVGWVLTPFSHTAFNWELVQGGLAFLEDKDSLEMGKNSIIRQELEPCRLLSTCVTFCVKQGCKAVLIMANDRNLSFRKLSQFPASHSPEETEPGSEPGTDHKYKPMLLSHAKQAWKARIKNLSWDLWWK